MTTNRQRKAASKKGVQITETDLYLLYHLMRYNGTTVPVLLHTMFVGYHRSGVYHRLERLVRAGLLEDTRTGPSNLGRPRDVHAIYVPTRLAYALLQSPLHYKPMTLTTIRHTLAVSEVGLDYQLQGFKVVTDREMRHDIAVWRANKGASTSGTADWVGDDEHISPLDPRLWSAPKAAITRCPDLVLLDEHGSKIAIEVELSKKSDTDLMRILRVYGRTQKYTEVRYHVQDGYLENRIRDFVQDMPSEERPNLTTRRYLPRHSKE